MSTRRPLPPVEGARVERGVGPTRQTTDPQDDQPMGQPTEQPTDQASGQSDERQALAIVPPAAPAQSPATGLYEPPVGRQDAGTSPFGPLNVSIPDQAQQQPRRPRAEDIIGPAEKPDTEQISAMVPAELELVKRMRLYWAHEGVLQRHQLALALDEWLRERNF